MCPNSNIELKVFSHYREHNIKQLLDFGLNVTINSDDPAYFKGYLNQNLENICEHLPLTQDDVVTLAKNSFNASFIDDALKAKYVDMIDQYVTNFK